MADRLLPGRITGFYLVGSAALGAWRPGRSDIDFVAVLGDRSDRTAGVVRRLRVLHVAGNAAAAGRALLRAQPAIPGTTNGAVLTFPAEVLADPDRYAEAAALPGGGAPGTDVAAAFGRRDLAITGFQQLRDGGRRALAEFYAAAVRLKQPQLDSWRTRWRDGALAAARLTGEHLDALRAGNADHLAQASVHGFSGPGERDRLGMCGVAGHLWLFPDPDRVDGPGTQRHPGWERCLRRGRRPHQAGEPDPPAGLAQRLVLPSRPGLRRQPGDVEAPARARDHGTRTGAGRARARPGTRPVARLDPRPARGHWRRFAEQLLSSKPPRKPLVPAHRVAITRLLGPPRLHYTVATGEVSSKEVAGDYALDTFAPRWHPLIRTALAHRSGRPARATLEPVRLPHFAGEFILGVGADADRLVCNGTGPAMGGFAAGAADPGSR